MSRVVAVEKCLRDVMDTLIEYSVDPSGITIEDFKQSIIALNVASTSLVLNYNTRKHVVKQRASHHGLIQPGAYHKALRDTNSTKKGHLYRIEQVDDNICDFVGRSGVNGSLHVDDFDIEPHHQLKLKDKYYNDADSGELVRYSGSDDIFDDHNGESVRLSNTHPILLGDKLYGRDEYDDENSSLSIIDGGGYKVVGDHYASDNDFIQVKSCATGAVGLAPCKYLSSVP